MTANNISYGGLMYCKQCGNQLNDGARYCSQCGASTFSQTFDEDQRTDHQPEESNIIQTKNGSKKEESSGYSCGCGCLVAILIIALFVVMLIVNASSSPDLKSPGDVINEIISREATNGDVNIDYELDIGSMSLNIIILPNSDIDNLEITIKYLDNNQNILKTDVIQIGNVKTGIQVTKHIQLTEFSFGELLDIAYYKISVTDGTVSRLKK